MLLPLLAFFQTLTGEPVPAAATYSGRVNAVHARPLRAEAEVKIDGALDEPVWARAVRLTGFSEFSPKDGLPAEDSTEVLVWYSSTAIHFGIRAFEPHGGASAVRARLADRDKIASDDQIQILLGTFGDGRQALVFGVNPLGVQMDGTIVEQGVSRSQGFVVSSAGREAPDRRLVFLAHRKATNGGGPRGQRGQSCSSRRARNRRSGAEEASSSARRYAVRASSSRPRRRSSSPRVACR